MTGWNAIWTVLQGTICGLCALCWLVPPLAAGTVTDATQLAEPDSRFLEVDGIQVHTRELGSGEPAVILLHGFGASLASWQRVQGGLALDQRVIAYDWVGFGLTGRPGRGSWKELNPYGTRGQAALLAGLLDRLGIRKAVLVGHSAGAAIAVETALRYPERISGLVLVDPALEPPAIPRPVRALLDTRPLNFLGALVSRLIAVSGDSTLRQAWHDPSRISPTDLAAYRKPLQVRGWNLALWEFTKAEKAPLLDQVGSLPQPVLILTGDDDRIIPTANTLGLQDRIPGSDLVVIGGSGHLPQEEQPAAFLEAVLPFLEKFR